MIKKTLLLLPIIILLVSCSNEPITTTSEITTTLLETTTTTTTSTTTTSTTTTTFTIPDKGELCAKLYSQNLHDICGETIDMNFFVVAPEKAKCTLGVKKGTDDIAYITITNYNVAPYRGIQVYRSPIFSLSRNIAINETGEISARYEKDNLNEVTFVQDNYLIEVSTWKTGAAKPITCTSEDTLELAKLVTENVKKLDWI